MQSTSPVIPSTTTVATALATALHELGVAHAFGVMGGAIAPFFRAIAESPIPLWHMRHEAGAAFAAIEASLVARRPTVVFTTAGPGITNALTGMLAARWEGAHVIFISASTSAAHRGRVATQETTAATAASTGVHFATSIEHPAQLAPVISQLASGLTRPGGFVAHLSLPIDLQTTPCALVAQAPVHASTLPAPEVIAHHAALLGDEPVIWLGHGARHAAGPIRRLAEHTGARVICSPRGKGIFPETHRQFLGVTGLGGHTRVEEVLATDRPRYTLVLGTRMGESTSFWSPELTPSQAFIHVDTDPTVFGAAYPAVSTLAVVAEVARYVTALADVLGAPPERSLSTASGTPRPPRARREGLVRPQAVLEELQRVFVDPGDTWIMAESGNSFCWSTHLLSFQQPNQYRVSTGFGSMGHAATAVVGAAIARRGKAVALLGDGSMLMQNELHAAVQHRADAVWVILNDAGYLMCAQGMKVMGWEPIACAMPRVDFVALARAVGADGERVTSEHELAAAMDRAARARGPWVIDVAIDPAEAPPSGRRNRSLMQQGFAGKGA